MRSALGDTEAATGATGARGSLSVRNLEVVYDDVILAVRGVSLEVPAGGIVALLGPNGAGKTTLLRAITGLLGVHRADITKGEIELDGRRITKLDPATIVRAGIGQVMEGRRVFHELTVDENLRAGAMTVRDRAEVETARERALELFPVLRERLKSTAGYLSGGEQQMLAIGRALMASPRLLLLDELSLGLAPRVVEQIMEVVREINSRGTSVLLVEQNARSALAIASHGYVMETGRVVLEGEAEQLRADRDVQEAYLGVGGGDARRSFRNVKTYRRRRRWGT